MILPNMREDKEGYWRAKISVNGINKWKDLGRTKDYFVARERAARLAEGGEPDFKADPPPTNGHTRPHDPDDWTADAVRNAAANGPEQSSEYFPPGSAPPVSDTPQPESSAAPDIGTEIPPDMFAGIIKQCAQTIVELQLHGQEYLWLRWGKIQPGDVPFNSEARKAPTALWETQLKKWFPTNVPIPEWAAAIILTAVMGGTIQFQGARPISQPEPGPGTVPQE